MFKLMEELNSLKDDDPELEEKAQRIMQGFAEIGGDIWKQRIRAIFEIASEYYVSRADVLINGQNTMTWSVEKK